jgi:hypothetical protein
VPAALNHSLAAFEMTLQEFMREKPLSRAAKMAVKSDGRLRGSSSQQHTISSAMSSGQSGAREGRRPEVQADMTLYNVIPSSSFGSNLVNMKLRTMPKAYTSAQK